MTAAPAVLSALSLFSPVWAQTRTEVITGSGGEGQVRGNPGISGGTGSGSVKTGASTRAGNLKSGLGAAQAPTLHNPSGGSVSADFSVPDSVMGIAPHGVSGSEATFAPSRRNGSKSLPLQSVGAVGVEADGVPELAPAGALAGLEHAVQGFGSILSAQRSAPSSPSGAAKSGTDLGLRESLDSVFENVRKASPLGMEPVGASGRGFEASILGKTQDAEGRIRQTAQLANTASPGDAPGLYLSAIKSAEETFPSRWAQSIGRAIRDAAGRKAEQALPDLADGAYAAASQGRSPEVDRSFKAFDQWERLLGVPGRPLVGNRSHLESDVREVLRGALASSPETAGPAAARAKVWFSRDARRSLQAVLPRSAVRPVPELASAFALPGVYGSDARLGLKAGVTRVEEAGDEDLWAAFEAQPTAFNGSRLVWRANRRAGASSPSGFIAAAGFWFRHQGGGLAAGGRRLAAALTSPVPNATRTLGDNIRAARASLSPGGVPRVRDARAALAATLAVGRSYRVVSGDPSIEQAADSLAKRFEAVVRAEALSPEDLIPAGPSVWILGGGPGSLGHWIDRAEQEEALSAVVPPAPAFPGLGLDEAEAVRARIGRVLSEIGTAPERARALGEWLSSHPGAVPKTRLVGRVGAFMARSYSVGAPSGRVDLTMLVDGRSGRVAFARAEGSGGMVLSAPQLSRLLAVE